MYALRDTIGTEVDLRGMEKDEVDLKDSLAETGRTLAEYLA